MNSNDVNFKKSFFYFLTLTILFFPVVKMIKKRFMNQRDLLQGDNFTVKKSREFVDHLETIFFCV